MKVIVFGNSGSGKSTLAKKLSKRDDLSHLDLDTIAWLDTVPPQRAPLAESEKTIQQFASKHPSWVIEGCYSDLLTCAAPFATDMIYLNLEVSLCIANAQARPWEPHKYASKKLQDENLPMLLTWIADYEVRKDTFSKQTHERVFENFTGNKVRYTSNTHSSYSAKQDSN